MTNMLKIIQIKIVATIITIFIMPVFSVIAKNSVDREEIGGWLIQTRSRPHEEIDPLCIIYSPSKYGTFIQINNLLRKPPSRRGIGFFAIYTDRIISHEAAIILPKASIRIDGKERWRRDVGWRKLGDDRGSLGLRLENDIDKLIRSFASGRTVAMVVSTPDGQEHYFEVDLTGFDRAIAVFEKCLAKVRVAPE